MWDVIFFVRSGALSRLDKDLEVSVSHLDGRLVDFW